MKNVKGQGGITLVALVVTIVVLLILAGITITYVLSPGGIFGKANQAAIDTEKGLLLDYLSTAITAVQMDDITNPAYSTAVTDFKATLTGAHLTVTEGSPALTFTKGTGIAGNFECTVNKYTFTVTLTDYSTVPTVTQKVS